AGYWNKRLGILGALGSCFAFIATMTIIPFMPVMPGGWAPSAGGFPAMTERAALLMKDLVLFAVSVYLLRQDVIRASLLKTPASVRLERATDADARTIEKESMLPNGYQLTIKEWRKPLS